MPSNEEMKKLFVQIDLRRQEEENKKTQILEVVAVAKVSHDGNMKIYLQDIHFDYLPVFWCFLGAFICFGE